MKIRSRDIGPNHPPYIIAEIGVNHDGSADRALALVDAAAEARADAVKFQMFEAGLLMSRASGLAAYQVAAGEQDAVAMLRRLQLPDTALRACAARANSRGLAAIATVFSLELVERAAGLGFDAFKTASPDIVHRPLLLGLARLGKPLIVSTGASTLDEVTRAVSWLAGTAGPMALLQCVSSYPTAAEDAAFEGIGALAAACPGRPIGYSDHLLGELSGAQAVCMGACILEKHFTHDPRAAGPDHAASLDRAGLERYALLARAAWNAGKQAPDERAAAFRRATGTEWERVLPRGSVNAPWVKRVLACEEDVRKLSRQSIVARRDLAAGAELRSEDLTFKRPGTGLAPFELDGVLGKVLEKPVGADTPITSDHLRR